MKNLFLLSLLFIQPIIVFSQTIADYTRAMDRYTGYYNQWLPDSIYYMLPDYLSEQQKSTSVTGIENFKKQYGEIKSSKYITLETSPNRIAIFKVMYARQDFILGISFDKRISFDKGDNASIVPFASKSPFIDSLLKDEINPVTINNNMVYYKQYRAAKRNAKTVMITGFVGMGTSMVLFVGSIGALLSNYNPNAGPGQINPNPPNYTGLAVGLFVTGAVVFIAGSAMAIGGGIGMHKKYRWSVIGPKNNETGIGYNF